MLASQGICGCFTRCIVGVGHGIFIHGYESPMGSSCAAWRSTLVCWCHDHLRRGGIASAMKRKLLVANSRDCTRLVICHHVRSIPSKSRTQQQLFAPRQCLVTIQLKYPLMERL